MNRVVNAAIVLSHSFRIPNEIYISVEPILRKVIKRDEFSPESDEELITNCYALWDLSKQLKDDFVIRLTARNLANIEFTNLQNGLTPRLASNLRKWSGIKLHPYRKTWSRKEQDGKGLSDEERRRHEDASLTEDFWSKVFQKTVVDGTARFDKETGNTFFSWILKIGKNHIKDLHRREVGASARDFKALLTEYESLRRADRVAEADRCWMKIQDLVTPEIRKNLACAMKEHTEISEQQGDLTDRILQKLREHLDDGSVPADVNPWLEQMISDVLREKKLNDVEAIVVLAESVPRSMVSLDDKQDLIKSPPTAGNHPWELYSELILMLSDRGLECFSDLRELAVEYEAVRPSGYVWEGRTPLERIDSVANPPTQQAVAGLLHDFRASLARCIESSFRPGRFLRDWWVGLNLLEKQIHVLHLRYEPGYVAQILNRPPQAVSTRRWELIDSQLQPLLDALPKDPSPGTRTRIQKGLVICSVRYVRKVFSDVLKPEIPDKKQREAVVERLTETTMSSVVQSLDGVRTRKEFKSLIDRIATAVFYKLLAKQVKFDVGI